MIEIYNPLFKIKTNKHCNIDKQIKDSSSAVRELQCLYEKHNDLYIIEHSFLIVINRNNKIINVYMISKGDNKATLMNPVIIFKLLVDNLASSFIVAHNHPSENLKPSDSDIKTINKLKEIGNLFNISMLDSIIFTKTKYFSFADEGLI